MEELENALFSSIVGALEYQAQMRPEKSAILYPDSNTNSTEYASLTYKQYNNVTNHLAEKICKYLPPFSENESITCGLLSVGGIEYLLSQYALLKLSNVIMFPISARNSEAAVEHLIKETKTILLLTTSQYLPMIKKIQQQFESLKILLLDSEEFKIEELLKNKDVECSVTSGVITLKRSREEELNKIVLILHSSGSTAHPKPIRLTNRYFLIGIYAYLSINKDFWEESDVLLTWGALFHILAFSASVRSIIIGATYALPLCVNFPPKPGELLRNIQVKNGITILITVPSLLEELIRELLSEQNQNIGLKPLQKLKFIMYGGAGCPDQLCRTLVDNEIVLLSIYGATETGGILVNNFKPYHKRWKVMQLPPIRKPFVRIETLPNSQNPNEKILIHLPNDPFLAENVSNSPDGCYTVGDILLEDPPNSGEYLVLGRQDDTLVHINGEKTNPIPMENIIRRELIVKQVAIIGHNQFCTAVLIQLNIEEASKYDFDEIENIIWKIVQQANEEAPSHSRIVKQLIKILPINQILPVTEKGNLMRQKVNQQYSTLINTIYDQFFNQQYENNQKKESKLTKEKLEEFFFEKLKLFGINNNDYSKSIFDFGVNSLQIIELRNLISTQIYEIPKTFLYEYSSIDQIVEQLIKYQNFQSIENDQFDYQLTEQIIDKYIQLIKQNQISTIKIKSNQISERIFLITGANGSLANFIIKDLLKQPSTIVKRIYCLLRGSDTKERLFQSFKQRKLNILFDERLIILSESMNLNDQYLGQTKEIYEQLINQITDIIHLAWKMDFNQTINDFQYDSIEGTFNLLKLSSTNNITFHFISSISSAASGYLTDIKEEPLPRNPLIPLKQGYGQSKYVTEHLCWAAMDLWNVPVYIYRVGQISGDTENGVWNRNDMAAMMIYAGAGKLKKMPNIGQDINWIPMDICSASIIDLVLKLSDQHVYHIINPNSISYKQYLIYLKQSGLQFDIIEIKEFIEEILNIKDQTNPLIKLSSFFQQIFNKKDYSKLIRFQTIKTIQQCQILKDCPQIDSNLIKLYCNYWTTSQLIE